MSHSTDISLSLEVLSEPAIADNINVIPNPPRKNSTTSGLVCSKGPKCKSLELLIEAMENDLFNPT